MDQIYIGKQSTIYDYTAYVRRIIRYLKKLMHGTVYV